MDVAAGLFERGAGSIQNQPFAERLGEGRYLRVKIVRHAERQTTAGNNIICFARPPRQLVETVLLDLFRDFGSWENKAKLVAGRAFFNGEAFAGEAGNGDGVVGDIFLVQQMPDHLARSTAGRENRDRVAA